MPSILILKSQPTTRREAQILFSSVDNYMRMHGFRVINPSPRIYFSEDNTSSSEMNIHIKSLKTLDNFSSFVKKINFVESMKSM